MRWKIFQWLKFLFTYFSNWRKLSRQKFHNELECVFTPHHASKNADRNQQQLKDGGILAIGTAQIIRIVSYPIRKSPHSGFLACDLWKDCIMPSSRKQMTEIKWEGQPRPQGAFPWLWGRQSQGKAPWGRGCERAWSQARIYLNQGS